MAPNKVPTQSMELRSRTSRTRSGRPYGAPPQLHRPSLMSRGRRLQRTSPATISTLHWTKLPAEIRLMILEQLQNQGEPQAPYAQVSHEWRVFVERSTFRRLVLSSGDLDAFHALVARRRTNVHLQVPIDHIWLRLVLPEYNCPDCERPENRLEVATNDKMFTEAMWKLLQALALLGPGRGLTLEFSAHSPSDSAHFFKSWYQLRPDYPHFATPDEHFTYVNRAKKYLPTDDKAHGYDEGNRRARWIRIYADSRRQCKHAQRLVRPLKFDSTQYSSLPKVPCVTNLLIRRQYFRDIETSSLSHIVGALRSLRRLQRENWRRFGSKERHKDAAHYGLPLHLVSNKAFRKALPFRLAPSLPRSLTHLQLFEDFDAQLYGPLAVCAHLFSPVNMLLPCLSKSTPKLQVLAVSFLTDAIDVFDLRWSYLLERPDGTIWDEATRQCAIDTSTDFFLNMEFVVLTSQEHLRPDQNRSKINALLRAAAAVALKMPKLKTMELWNCGQGQACVFRYEAVDYSAPEPEHSDECRLTWRSTWGRARDLVVEPAVLEAWEGVARAHGYPPSVLFERRPLPVGVRAREYTSHHDLLRLGELKLARYVLHDTSRAQASAEADMTPDQLMWYNGY
ncbi:hypothetical protein CONLIGDRAFT_684600 [Coniochaeta ligniaria NRRL 30616]|uniref:DUF6546 domain-containing protein n=1 Tax=Coniochaeta ligniaria NRRL 30616 TaxID=1408157 RepID=A0A1J7IED1_9PEZI|nr:hypothetical protein CONLIGDRAFT_684600 [Coniochaeta ligniaria NRRL 30616]